MWCSPQNTCSHTQVERLGTVRAADCCASFVSTAIPAVKFCFRGRIGALVLMPFELWSTHYKIFLGELLAELLPLVE